MSAHSDLAVRLTDLLDRPRSINDLIIALTELTLARPPEHVDQAIADAISTLIDLRAEIHAAL